MTIGSLARILAACVITLAGLITLGAVVLTVSALPTTTWTAEGVLIVAVTDVCAAASLTAAVYLWRQTRQLT